MSIDEQKKELLDMLNRLFNIRNITQGELNKVITFGNKVPELEELEQEFQELGLARYDTNQEGVSVFSLFATVTRVLCGESLAFCIEGEGPSAIITGVQWLPNQNFTHKEDQNGNSHK